MTRQRKAELFWIPEDVDQQGIRERSLHQLTLRRSLGPTRLRSANGSQPAAVIRAGGTAGVAASSRPRRAVSLRMRSVIRLEATWISQPTGFSGVPCAGHWAVAGPSVAR